MNSLDIARESIKKSEGLRLKPYNCPAGKLSIGYGQNLEDNGISQAAAEFMLEEHIQAAVSDLEVFPFFDTLSAERQAVLIDMRYNLGLPRFLTFRRMLNALQLHDYGSAAKEMLDSRWAKQVGTRAAKLSRIMAINTSAEIT